MSRCAPHSNEPEIRYAIGGSWASTAFGEPRFTNDVDILVEFTEQNLEWFLGNLPDTFYMDTAEALTAIRCGRPFNVIYMPMAFTGFLFGSFYSGEESKRGFTPKKLTSADRMLTPGTKIVDLGIREIQAVRFARRDQREFRHR